MASLQEKTRDAWYDYKANTTLPKQNYLAIYEAFISAYEKGYLDGQTSIHAPRVV